MVAGGILLTLEVLALLASLTPSNDDDNIVIGFVQPLVSIAMFAVNIWGSVVVFGKLNKYLNLLNFLKISAFLKLSFQVRTQNGVMMINQTKTTANTHHLCSLSLC